MTDSYNYICNLVGAASGVEEKKLTYELYTENNAVTPIRTWEE
jgi:hypothetical protein